MAASFPNAKKTFSQIVNGITKVLGAGVNVAYDEIEALETFIGATGGGAQAYSESLTNLLLNYRRGCRCDFKGAADLYVRSGEIMITDASGNRRLRRNTSDTTVDWTNIDTGSEANSTTYYIYAVADASATTFTVKISTNATTPTGCTFYRKIGQFYNDSSGNIVAGAVISLFLDPQFGEWETKAIDTVYLAATDGFVVATAAYASGNQSLNALTDASNPPTTVRCSLGASTVAGFWNVITPVRKGDYYKVAQGAGSFSSNAVYFIPLSK